MFPAVLSVDPFPPPWQTVLSTGRPRSGEKVGKKMDVVALPVTASDGHNLRSSIMTLRAKLLQHLPKMVLAKITFYQAPLQNCMHAI